MRVISLFSGGGFGDLGFVMAGCEIVAQVEIDEYCQKLLALRYPDAKKFRDIRTVKGSDLPECDIITGGFPCQPFSVAGKQRGKDDDRHLWPQMFRIISEKKPTWVVGENVPGFIDIALNDVCFDMESIGYETFTLVFPAHALGAWHERKRVWVIANTNSLLLQGALQKYSKDDEQSSRSSNSICSLFTEPQFKQFGNYRGIRKTDGCANTMDRLKCLGNGQVPACTKWIAEQIIKFEGGRDGE